jgi:hypothetical protein
MLSTDELTDGTTFILKLPDLDGNVIYWVQKLMGDVARHWYNIYRQSDWQALRNEAADVFVAPVPQADAERIQKLQRCVVIQPHRMNSTDLMAAHGVH